jgi:ELWxxDGT repeat protein
MIKDIVPGSDGSGPAYLTAVGDTLFFRANDKTHGNELWKSDGTSAGTVMVKDIFLGSDSSELTHLTALGDTLFFRANDGTHGFEIWKSDGTTTGTVMIKDIIPGSSGSNPYHFTAVDDTLFFRAYDEIHGNELYCYMEPEVEIEKLMDNVKGMDLSQGTEKNLISKLNDAIKLVKKENFNGVVHKLNDFINYIEGQTGKKLTEEQADELIANAKLIKDMISARI